MIWKELIKTAILGTAQAGLTEKALQFLEREGVPVDQELSEKVLSGATLIRQRRKAGFLLHTNEEAPPSLHTESSDESYCSPATATYLTKILEEPYKDVLPEFVHYGVKNNKSLPPQSLPDLFYQSLGDPVLWDQIKPIIGGRGRWLLKQNNDWQELQEVTDIKTWEYGSKKERIQLLKHLRNTQAEDALSLLNKTWEEESIHDKISFLIILKINASLRDEPFLERCLKEKNREIRESAIQLLSKLQKSSFSKRIILLGERLLQLNEKDHLEVTLPDESEKIWQEVAIRRGVKYPGGLKANIIGQIISLIPPVFWADHFEKNQVEILRIFLKSDWKNMLIHAIADATILHEDKIWAKNLLKYWLDEGSLPVWKKVPVLSLIKVLNEADFDELARKSIERNPEGLFGSTQLSQFLFERKQAWEDSLARRIVHLVRDYMKNEESLFWNQDFHKKLFSHIALKTNPFLYTEFSKGWPHDTPYWAFWEQAVLDCLDILKFRKKMIEAFSK